MNLVPATPDYYRQLFHEHVDLRADICAHLQEQVAFLYDFARYMMTPDPRHLHPVGSPQSNARAAEEQRLAAEWSALERELREQLGAKP